MDMNSRGHACMSGLNPPPWSAVASDEEHAGRRLMALVRSAEKSIADEKELCDMLAELTSLYSRRGLLLENTDTASKVLEASSHSSSTTKSRGGKQREPSTETLAPHDASLVGSALARILSKESTMSSTVVAWAAKASIAIVTNIQDGVETRCAMAERELVLKSSRALLTGLGSTMTTLIAKQSSEHDTCALVFCLQATSRLVSLLGQKAPRSAIPCIRKVAYTALVDGNCAPAYRSSALLLSVLPLTAANSTSPADAWSTSVMDVIAALNTVLDAMAHLRPRKTKLKMQSEEAQSFVSKWIDHVTTMGNETERVEAFQACIRGFSSLLVALLTRQAYHETTRIRMMTSKLAIEPLLDLVDSMIAFPSEAETIFFATKKRLRLEVVNNGLLSPAALVLEAANLTKCMGHDILDASIEASGSALLPHARKVMRVTNTSLLSSSSTALQVVLDPAKNALHTDGRRKRWLHTSVLLRTKAIRTYAVAVQTLGVGVVVGSLSKNETMGVDEHNEYQAISCIGGSLLEQLVLTSETKEDWATLMERVDLSTAALSALSTLLTTGGGHLPLACRSSIDSMAETCLSLIRSESNCPLCQIPKIRDEILKLGCACLCTPWPDGAMSSIMSELQHAAQVCARDSDSNVALGGAACSRMCHALCMPRVPALSIVANREHSQNSQPAISLVESVKVAQEGISRDENVASPDQSWPFEDDTFNRVERVKRQKFQHVETEHASRSKLKDTGDTTKNAASKAGHRGDAVQSEEAHLGNTSTVFAETPLESSDAANTRMDVSQDGVVETEMGSREESSDIKEADAVDAAPTPSPRRELHDSESDDEFDFPNIVVDGGPDEEDQ